MCRGRGEKWTGWSWVECLDCHGEGRVKHCVACAGRGKLWLGGGEYIDCPVCPSMLGGAQKPKTYIAMNGVKFERRPIHADIQS